MRGVDAAAGLNTGCGAQVQHHVVIWLAPGVAVGVVVPKVLVQRVVGILDARGVTETVVQAGGLKASASDAHPGHRVQAHVVPGVNLGQ